MATIWIHNRKTSKTDETAIKKLPKLSKDQFLKLISTKGNKVITDDSITSSAESHRRNAKINLGTLKKLLNTNKRYFDELNSIPQIENPFEIIVKNGREVKVGMINKDAMVFDIVRNHYNTQSKLNRYRIYKTIYDGIIGNAELSTDMFSKFRNLPQPSKHF